MDKLKEKFLNRQFLTFCFIGAGNTILSQGLYILFVLQNVSVGISSVLGDILSMVFSYFMNMRFTYHKKPGWKSAVTFPISYIPGIVIAALMTMLVVDVFHGPELWAKALSLPLSIPLNYLCMNIIVKKFAKNS